LDDSCIWYFSGTNALCDGNDQGQSEPIASSEITINLTKNAAVSTPTCRAGKTTVIRLSDFAPPLKGYLTNELLWDIQNSLPPFPFPEKESTKKQDKTLSPFRAGAKGIIHCLFVC
jgi:hypothetical protein